MKHYESAFLGLILAGVLMMIIGLGLMLAPARSQGAARAVHVENRSVDLAPGFAAHASDPRGGAVAARIVASSR